MSATQQQRTVEDALARIQRMLPRTAANGASQNEVDSAARQIGRLIMQFPELIGQSQRPRTEPQSDGDTVKMAHSGIWQTTDKAMQFSICGQFVWLPKSQLRGWDNYTVEMTRWIAAQKGLVTS